VAGENKPVVDRLLALAEDVREDIGDYNKVGRNMRFFDPIDKRPETPVFLRLQKKVKKKP
jgi:hypothetical protein